LGLGVVGFLRYRAREVSVYKIKMLLLVFQIEGFLKKSVPRKSEYTEMKRLLDVIRNKIIDARVF
jgi:hypothetical protein